MVKQQLGCGARIYNHKNLNNLLHLRMANLNKLNVLHYINENINSEIEIKKEIYKNSLWNKYNNKNDDSWINYVDWQPFLGQFLYRHLFSKSNWR
ncbi:hypothetical protein [Spiroplasma endosymbiont of Agriotes lineatus]|uniref:hypothetical protein n=1 Tax=Spiroplasma endosymbiont of Agriotes lineatus TaxID=3077930 RepID=UPI0030CE30CB